MADSVDSGWMLRRIDKIVDIAGKVVRPLKFFAAMSFSAAETVSGSSVIDELGQGRAVEALTRDDVGEDANGASLNEPVALGVGVLVVGRDASVAQGVAHAGRRHRLNIVRFQDGFRGHTLSSVQGARDRLESGTIVLGTRQWLHDVLYRHRCAKRYSGFPPTSLRWSATIFWPMMILI